MAFGDFTFSTKTFDAFGGAASDIFSSMAKSSALKLQAQGNRTEAANYDLAAKLAGENAGFAKVSGDVKLEMADRQVYMGLGTERAQIAGAGFQVGTGTALDLLRSSTEQGALQEALIGQQTNINVAGYKEQQQSYENLASYARMAADAQDNQGGFLGSLGMITGGFKAAAGIASIFMV